MRIFAWNFCFVVLFLASFVRSQFPLSGCPSTCPYKLQCLIAQRCDYGTETDYCSCCSRCLKGPGEACGGQFGSIGKCAEGFYCETAALGISGFGNPVGVCRPKLSSPCLLPCELVRCPIPYFCPYGAERGLCGCCTVCLKGFGQSCGRIESCGSGLYCEQPLFQGGYCNYWNVLTLPDPVETNFEF